MPKYRMRMPGSWCQAKQKAKIAKIADACNHFKFLTLNDVKAVKMKN